MKQEKKSGAGLLITQSIVVAILLATALTVRLIGGPLYAEWKSAWESSMSDNHWIDIPVSALVGEPDGEQTEVTP